jgi:hypothetical protein
MTYTPIDGWDATGADLANAPKTGQAAGYITGIDGVPWSQAQMAAHPGFVQIDQSDVIDAIDDLADAYDVENGAITVAEIAQLVKDGQAGWSKALRPGQRWPAVYCSENSVTQVVNALVAGGVESCPLGVADYSWTHAEAVSLVQNASGPYPIVWVQYNDAGAYDQDVFSKEWLDNVSKKGDPPVAVKPLVPPGQWNNPEQWSWDEVVITGTGLDGNLYVFAFNPETGEWIRQSLPGLERD